MHSWRFGAVVKTDEIHSRKLTRDNWIVRLMVRLDPHKEKIMKIGLSFLAIALMLTYASYFAESLLGQGMSIYLILLGLTGISGFTLLVLSIFLPRKRGEKPTFTQELLGREKLQYGVYTDGNWMSVLQDMDRKEKERRKRK
jgi:hypothetical protein